MPQLSHLESAFPKLAAAGYFKTSDPTGLPGTPGTFNCIAWAAQDTHHDFWWPEHDGYWPFWIKPEPKARCFVNTFRWLGYCLCDHSRREFAFDKVALYAIHKSRQPVSPPRALDDFGEWEPTHMARQLSDGSWTSKCGANEDITHFTLDALESYGPRYGPNRKEEYGCAVLYMKRFVLISWVVRALQALAFRLARNVSR